MKIEPKALTLTQGHRTGDCTEIHLKDPVNTVGPQVSLGMVSGVVVLGFWVRSFLGSIQNLIRLWKQLNMDLNKEPQDVLVYLVGKEEE